MNESESRVEAAGGCFLRDPMFDELTMRQPSESDDYNDAVQDFALWYLKRDDRSPIANPKSYFYKAVRNIKRKNASQRFKVYDDEEEAVEDMAQRLEAGAELHERLGAALQRLSDQTRAAIILRHDGLTTEEIAAALGTPALALALGVVATIALPKPRRPEDDLHDHHDHASDRG